MAFTYFDDSRTPTIIAKPTRSGKVYPFDNLRQGVEVTNSKFLYGSSQPKFYAGNDYTDTDANKSGFIDHSTKIVTHGQDQGFIETQGSSIFEETLIFNPVDYVSLGILYPLPLNLNEGPGQGIEAILEPLTIPFRLKTNEGKFHARDIHAELEDGNNFFNQAKSANKIQSFIETAPCITKSFFLDGGEENIGGIIIEGYTANIERLISPFDDLEIEKISRSVKTNDVLFTNALLQMNLNNDEDIRPYKNNSSTCGFSTVSRNGEGTDSIAYNNLLRGY